MSTRSSVSPFPGPNSPNSRVLSTLFSSLSSVPPHPSVHCSALRSALTSPLALNGLGGCGGGGPQTLRNSWGEVSMPGRRHWHPSRKRILCCIAPQAKVVWMRHILGVKGECLFMTKALIDVTVIVTCRPLVED